MHPVRTPGWLLCSVLLSDASQLASFPTNDGSGLFGHGDHEHFASAPLRRGVALAFATVEGDSRATRPDYTRGRYIQTSEVNRRSARESGSGLGIRSRPDVGGE